MMISMTNEREVDPFSEAIPRTDITIAATAGRGDRAQNIRVSRRRSPGGQWRIVLTPLDGEPIAEMSTGAARMLARQLLTETSDSGTERRLLGYWREIQIADPTT
jgi:hypothetical protein